MKSSLKTIIVLVLLFASMSIAIADEIEYDQKYARQEEVFKSLVWQTTDCMSTGAMNAVRMGQRDSGEIAAFLSKVCGGQLYRYSTIELKIAPQRVTRLLLAMALDEIKNTPGVTIKKPK